MPTEIGRLTALNVLYDARPAELREWTGERVADFQINSRCSIVLFFVENVANLAARH